MIDRMRGLSESVEYWDLNADRDTGIAEIEFVRPGGGRITLAIPVEQLSDLERDIVKANLGAQRRPSGGRSVG